MVDQPNGAVRRIMELERDLGATLTALRRIHRHAVKHGVASSKPNERRLALLHVAELARAALAPHSNRKGIQ